MSVQTHSQSQMGSVFSLFATVVVALLSVALGLLSGVVLEPFAAMFQGLEVRLPWMTRFLLDTRGWPFRLLFFGLALFVIWKETSVPDLRRRLVLSARAFILLLVTLGLVIFALYLPLFALLAKLIKLK
ncbi:MAG: hypothetical protein WCE61_19560 [Candidatus Acidiferrum sp.]